MNSRLRSFSDVIDTFGVVELARLMHTNESHVRVMKTRNSIPPEYWGFVIDEAIRLGLIEITYKRLHQLRQMRFNRRRAAA